MAFETWLAFVAASTLLLIIPGPTILTVIGYSVKYGSLYTRPLVVAVVLGDATALAATLTGLGAVLATSSFWFGLIKTVGGIYLLLAGLRLIYKSRRSATLSKPELPSSSEQAFWHTYLVTSFNPKGILFFIAFLPQFINSSQPAAWQFFMLACTFIILAAVNTVCYAKFAAYARVLLRSPRGESHVNLASGGLFTAAGIWALLSKPTV